MKAHNQLFDGLHPRNEYHPVQPRKKKGIPRAIVGSNLRHHLLENQLLPFFRSIWKYFDYL